MLLHMGFCYVIIYLFEIYTAYQEWLRDWLDDARQPIPVTRC